MDIALRTEWTLYFSHQEGDQLNVADFMDNVLPIVTTNSLRTLFEFYQYLKPPNLIGTNQGYHFFRKGIRPAYEDPAHANCARIKLMLNAGYASLVWEMLLTLIFRGLADEFPSITGIDFRRGRTTQNEFVAIWLRDRTDSETDRLIRALQTHLQVESLDCFHIQSNK